MSGLETPDTIDLRKRAGTDTPDTMASYPRELYHVIQEKKSGKGDGAGQFFGSDKTYVLPGRAGVELSINPDQLESQLQADSLKDAYEADKAGREGGEGGEDQEDPRHKRKRRTDTSMAAKRHKDFKF